MKHVANALVVLGVILLTTTGSATTPQSIEVTRNLTSMPLAFTENQGQWDEQVSFRAIAGGATMWFTKDGAVYQFTRRVPTNSVIASDQRERGNLMGAREARESGLPVTPSAVEGLSGVEGPHNLVPSGVEGRHHQPDSIESIAIKANFVGSNPNPRMVGLGEMEYKCNYFIGNDPNEWHTDVPNYEAIVYEDIYSGIDLKYYGNGKQMEYDFIVSPGADFSQIEMLYEGAESISISAVGELVVETKWGDVVERRPVVYQMKGDKRSPIKGEYVLLSDNTFGFRLKNGYNPELALVIDPVLSYSTYLGGSNYDRGNDIAVDGSGNAYVTGITQSTDFPIEGEFQTDQSNWDAFVTKLNSSNNALVYSTYVGGSGPDYGLRIAVDGSDKAYITGYTKSTNFPTTPNAYDTSHNGGYDAFVMKLSATGNLVYCTYLGGNDDDFGRGIAVDGFGNAFITGNTLSTNFPTEGEYQTDQGGWDGFATKLNSSGNALVYSTYLGRGLWDVGLGIAVDGSGNAYITGSTGSTDFPTEGEYQTDQPGLDAFVTKLNSSGNTLIYSTYLGGSSSDRGNDIAVDGLGNAYIAGDTWSTDFPTEGAFQSHRDSSDVFVTKLSSSGNALVYSTYLGGSNNDYGYGIAVGGDGNAYIIGITRSTDFPVEAEYQTYQGGGDAFVTRLSSSGNALAYSTYLGGYGFEIGVGITVDGSGSAYVTGGTSSTDFPTTPDAYDTSYNGGYDAYVMKFLADFCIDTDGDGICDSVDNCPDAYNPDQEDYDLDGIGDSCDPCNDFPPVIADVGDTVMAQFLTEFRYCPEITDPDNDSHTIIYTEYPHWCLIQNDTVVGIAPDTVFVEPVTAIVQDTCNADTVSFVVVIYLCGDVNADQVGPDISDLVYLIDYMFQGGPPPPVMAAADVDASDDPINISDLMYLIDYMFTGGPPPVCP